jgi:nucleotide-binding universal stress UspA family protein
MLKIILVPLDGSELGELALVYAKELAGALNLQVQIAFVAEHRDKKTSQMFVNYLAKVAERLRTQVKRIKQESEINTVVLNGEPASALIEYSKKEGVDLLIMMSHGRSGLMPWVMGGTANKVVQRSQIPVLLVRASEALSRRRPVQVFKKILLPLDGSPMGEAALPYVKTIAQALDCEIILLRVVEAVQRIYTVGGIDHFAYTEQQIERMKNEAQQYLEKTNRQFEKVKVSNVLRIGDAAREIIKVSDEEKVNLIAMSSYGKSGITQWVMGSVSNKVLQAGKTPILLVRPGKNTSE